MKMRFSSWKALIAVLLLTAPAVATTIIPAADPGELALDSTAVFLARAGASRAVMRPSFISTETELEVLSVVKGPLTVGEMIFTTVPGGEKDGVGWAVAGTPRFAEGRVYLFFADLGPGGSWRPRLLADSVLRRETEKDGTQILVPVKEAWELDRFSAGENATGLVPAPVVEARFLERLRLSLQQGRAGGWDWAPLLAESAKMWSALKAAPADCVFLTYSDSEIPIRWKKFDDGGSQGLWADSAGDESVAGGAFNEVSNAVARWMAVPSTNLDLKYEGPRDFTLTCTGDDNDAPRDPMVVFNDPCDDIDDLVNCGGTLAFGGPWFSGTHSFDGRVWYSATSWFVVVNNGIVPCISTPTYELMITHELGHGLGFGHTADSSSLMYETCCNEHNELDNTCTQYTYPEDVTLADDVTIPVVAHLDGVGGTPWRSDVAITNPDDVGTMMRLEYRPAEGEVVNVSRTFPPAGTLLLEDIVAEVFRAGDGRGPLKVIQMGPATERPVVVSRSFAERLFGNLGSGLPGDVLPATGSVSMPGLFHNDTFRSNISLTAGTSEDVTATFELFLGKDGQVGARRERVVSAGLQDQWSMQTLFPHQEFDGAPMTVRVTMEHPGIVNASLVDEVSTDAAVYLGKEPATSWIVPVVAHNPGEEGTFWSSTVSVWNASGAPNSLWLEYLPENTNNSGGGFPSPEIILEPFETLSLEDVVLELFHVSDGKGALRVEATDPVTVTSRVFTAAVDGGSIGHRVRSVHASDLSTSEVVLPGVRLVDGFRTNLGLMTGDSATEFKVDLKAGDGSLVVTTALTVNPRTLRQLSVERLFGSGFVTPDPVGSIVVRGNAGFLAYLTVVDGSSQDPIFVMPK